MINIKRKLYLLPLFLILLPKITCAQQPIIADSVDFQEIVIEQIGIDQGLSQGMIFSMIQDHKGYIWAGTKDGLNRYNGIGFKVYRHKEDDSLSISENVIYSLVEDSKNRLWIGSSNSGINLFDPLTESFIRFDNLPENRIGSAEKNQDGLPVFELKEKGYVIIFEKKDLKNDDLKNSFEFKKLDVVYPQLNNLPKVGTKFNRLRFSPGGDVWYAYNDTIYGCTAEMLKQGKELLKFHYNPNESIDDIHSSPFFFDSNNNTYITSYGKILKIFNRSTNKFDSILQLPDGYSFNVSIFIDNQNRVWSWLPNQNLIRIQLWDGKMTVIKPQTSNKNNFIERDLDFVFEGTNNNIWIRSNGFGLKKISAREEMFKEMPSSSLKVLDRIWSYRIEKSGRKAYFDKELHSKWLATITNWIEKNKNKIKVAGEGLLAAHDGDSHFYLTYSLFSGEENQLMRIEDKTGESEVLLVNKNSKPGEWFGQPCFWDNNGDLWVTKRHKKGETFLIHLKQNEVIEEKLILPFEPADFEYRLLSDVFQDKQGVLWLGTIQGLVSFHPKTNKTEYFSNKPGDKNSLSKNTILSLCPDPHQPQRFIWVGTEGGGLNKFDIQSKTFTRFTTDNGLPNNVVYGILTDKRKNLWLSTNKGICLFNPTTLEIRNFNQSDGLVSNEFNRYEYSQTEDGTMYFGSPTGVSYFDPEGFYKETMPSEVVICKLELFNKAVVYHKKSSEKNEIDFSLSGPIEHCKKLVFKHKHRMITLGFALLDFTTPNQNRFKYMLQGFDKEWINAETQNHATYTNLNPGSYTFKVIGCNSNNVWSEPTELSIVVLPPWWETWWFRLVFIMFLGSSLYTLYRYRLFKALELERLRNRIAQDLHDEIGSTLSSISLYSATIQKDPTGFSKKNIDILNKISQSATNMMESMNDMVWTIKADNDDFEQVINRMRSFAANMSEAKDIQLHFNVDKQALSRSLKMEQRKNIYLIFKEAVNNAVKYASCQNLFVYVALNNGFLEMKIIDDGCGFDINKVNEKDQLMGGNGLKGMENRAKRIQAKLEVVSKESNGTSVFLSMRLQNTLSKANHE